MDDITCPVCGMEAATFYVDDQRNIIGCSECLRAIDCDELEAEREEHAYSLWLDRETDELLERRACLA